MNLIEKVISNFSGISYVLIVPLSVVAGILLFENKSRNLKIVGCLIFVVHGICFWRFTIDDAYISLRYAQNVVEGFGFRYEKNLSIPPLEGYTNFLLVIAEVILFKLGVGIGKILVILKVAGLISTIYFIELSSKIAKWLYGLKASNTVFIGLCACPPLIFWAIGGLESPYFMLAIIAALYALTRNCRGKYYAATLLMIVASLFRPDAMIVTVFCLLSLYLLKVIRFRRLPIPEPLGPILVFLTFLMAITAWRMIYFGHPLPNTFYAKRAEFDLLIYSRRVIDLLPFIFGIAPLFLTIQRNNDTPLPRDKEELRNVVITFLVAFILICLMIKREWMPGYRYELPLIPLILILASKYTSSNLTQNSKISYVIPALFVLLTATSFQSLRAAVKYTDRLNASHVALGKWFKGNLPEINIIAGWDAGAIPLFSEVKQYTEIHPEGILSATTPRLGYKLEYLFKDQPDVIILPKGLDKNSDEGMSKILHYAIQNGFKKEFSVYRDCDFILEIYIKSERMNDTVLHSAKALEKESAAKNCPAVLEEISLTVIPT